MVLLEDARLVVPISLTSPMTMGLPDATPYRMWISCVVFVLVILPAWHAPGSAFLHRMLDFLAPAPSSYMRLLRSDVDWLYDAEKTVVNLPSIAEGPTLLVVWIIAHPKPWKNLLKRHKKARTAYFNLTNVTFQWDKSAQSKLYGLGVPRPDQ